jgi:asparagine synthase (glutamine-hydrolysing)
MCGIAGSTDSDELKINQMLNRIKHRGPDGMGIIGMHGHVRLSLVDLSETSSQPFIRKKTILAFNGEIWNFRELKKELEGSGEKFISSGDTEVLAAMLEKHGLHCLSKIDGMFAFSWTSQKNENYLVRDQFGKIPLYVAKTNKGYIWASERKAFDKGLQPVPVPPGYAFNLNNGEWVNYYNMPAKKSLTPDKLIEKLNAGVKKRLQADADICCLISGGLDSSLILSLATQYKKDLVAYTAKFNENATDLIAARKLCAELGVKLIEVPVNINLDILSESIASIEINSKAQIEIGVLCLPLAERISGDGFKACLSGEAADELFGGYGNFCIKASKADDEEVVKLRIKQLAKMARGNFIRTNKIFMSKSVECRLPFMEKDLVESAIQLNKTESPLGKKLIKLAAKNIVPDWVIKRPKETFQGSSGVSNQIQKLIRLPVKFYNNEIKKKFGYIPNN